MMKPMTSNKAGLYLVASAWSTLRGEVAHSEATAHTYSIKDSDNKVVALVTRHQGRWKLKLVEKKNVPESLYDSKEEALARAIAAY